MSGRFAPLVALVLLSLTRFSAAADIQPVPKTGACPPGYYSSGNYCLGRPDSKTVIEKLGPCPPGYYSSGNYCLQSR